MTFTRANALGWAYGEKLTSTQQNALDLDHSRAVDGYAGGTYWASAPLTLAGGASPNSAFVALSGATGSLYNKDQSIYVSVNSTTGTIQGTWQCANASTITLKNTAQIDLTNASKIVAGNGTTIELDGGSTLDIKSSCTFQAAADLAFSGNATVKWKSHTTADADETYFGAGSHYDVLIVPTLTGARTINLDAGHTGALLYVSTVGSGGAQKVVTVKNTGGATLGTLLTNPGAADQAFMVALFNGATWQELGRGYP